MNYKTVAIMIFILSLIKIHGADILGCPNGIPKGAFWPRITYQLIDMTEKWNQVEKKMSNIGENSGITERKLQKIDFRLGYGLTSKLDIGIQFVSIFGETKKNNGNGKSLSLNEEALTDIWLAAKYNILDLHNADAFLRYFKLSTGICAAYSPIDEVEQVLAGLGAGENKAKLGILAHGGIGIIDLSSHLLYEYHGKALNSDKKLKANDGTSNLFGFNKKGMDMPDKLIYDLTFEYELNSYIELKANLGGFAGLQDTKFVNGQGDIQNSFNAYVNNLGVGLAFFPLKNDYPKNKIVVNYVMPYSAKNTLTYDNTFKIICMWML